MGDNPGKETAMNAVCMGKKSISEMKERYWHFSGSSLVMPIFDFALTRSVVSHTRDSHKFLA